jgi:hypothetical protein
MLPTSAAFKYGEDKLRQPIPGLVNGIGYLRGVGILQSPPLQHDFFLQLASPDVIKASSGLGLGTISGIAGPYPFLGSLAIQKWPSLSVAKSPGSCGINTLSGTGANLFGQLQHPAASREMSQLLRAAGDSDFPFGDLVDAISEGGVGGDLAGGLAGIVGIGYEFVFRSDDGVVRKAVCVVQNLSKILMPLTQVSSHLAGVRPILQALGGLCEDVSGLGILEPIDEGLEEFLKNRSQRRQLAGNPIQNYEINSAARLQA